MFEKSGGHDFYSTIAGSSWEQLDSATQDDGTHAKSAREAAKLMCTVIKL